MRSPDRQGWIRAGWLCAGLLCAVPAPAASLATAAFFADSLTVENLSAASPQDTEPQDRSFIRHTVRRMETLYSIARKYKVDIEHIIQANRLPSDQVQRGQILLIPFPHKDFTPPRRSEVVTGQNLRIHIVEEGETGALLAMRYGCTRADLLATNRDAFKDGELMVGAAILVPAPAGETEEIEDPGQTEPLETDPRDLPCGNYTSDPATVHSVALLLPLPAQDLLNGKPRTAPFAAFYQGALLAVEKLKEKGMSLKLQVIDTEEADWTKAAAQLQARSLLIGPVTPDCLHSLFQNFSEEERQPWVVSPMDPRCEKLLPNHAQLIQVQPSAQDRAEALIGTLPKGEGPVWVVYEEGAEEPAALYRRILDERGLAYQQYAYNVLQGRSTADHLKNLMQAQQTNRVLIASENEAFVSDALRNMHLLMAFHQVPVQVYGTAAWQNFETLDLEAMHSLRVTLSVPVFADFADARTRDFVRAYRSHFQMEPNVYAFQGYDVCFYFLSALYKTGPGFGNCLEDFSPSGLLQGAYTFRRTTPQGGFQNRACRIITYLPDFSISLK